LSEFTGWEQKKRKKTGFTIISDMVAGENVLCTAFCPGSPGGRKTC